MKKGMTLVEILLSAALMSGVLMVAMMLMDKLGKEVSSSAEDIQDMIARLGTEGLLRNDLLSATDSFNFINLSSFDGDNINRSFFHYDPLLMEKCSDGQNIRNICKRRFTLDLTGSNLTSQPFYVIVTNSRDELRTPINPKSTFAATPLPPAPPNRPYQCVNYRAGDPAHDIEHVGDNDGDGKDDYSSPWKKGNLVLINSLMTYRDTNPSIQPGITEQNWINRKLSFMGVVGEDGVQCADGQELIAVNIPTVSGIPNINFHNSYTINGGSAFQITTARNLFERLPFLAAYPLLVMMNPVRILKYYIARNNPNTPQNEGSLHRALGVIKKSGNTYSISFDSDVVIQEHVIKVDFERDSIHLPIIRFTVTENKQ